MSKKADWSWDSYKSAPPSNETFFIYAFEEDCEWCRLFKECPKEIFDKLIKFAYKGYQEVEGGEPKPFDQFILSFKTTINGCYNRWIAPYKNSENQKVAI